MVSRYKCRPVIETAKPTLLGLLISLAVTMLLIAVFSLVFVIIEKIAESAIVPLALVSAAVGCFAGAFVCSVISHHRGVVCGAIIGIVMFVAIWIISVFSSDAIFGTDTFIKFIVLTGAGVAGGWIGKNRRFSR